MIKLKKNQINQVTRIHRVEFTHFFRMFSCESFFLLVLLQYLKTTTTKIFKPKQRIENQYNTDRLYCMRSCVKCYIIIIIIIIYF